MSRLSRGRTYSLASYILGEFLAETNAPLAFDAFAPRASKHALTFLCEADLDADAFALLNAETRQHLADMAGDDRIRAGHHLDLFSGRPFRRSLLVKAEAGRALRAQAHKTWADCISGRG